jgi:hypothetical protein
MIRNQVVRSIDRSIGFFQPEQIGDPVMQAREPGELQGIVIKFFCTYFLTVREARSCFWFYLGESLIRYNIVQWDYSNGRLD